MNNSMRIGINFQTSDKYISGVEYYSLGLINGLLRIDKKNEYIVFTNQPELIEDGVTEQGKLSVRKTVHLKTRLQRIMWEHFRLPEISKKEGLDVLHCPHYICPLCSGGVPYVATVHDTIAIDHPEWCRGSNALYYNIFMKHAVNKAARLIAVSRSTSEDIKRNFCVNGSKVRTIYPGIDAIFNADQNFLCQSQVKTQYGLPERYILFVGNTEPKKNISSLIRAYKLLKAKGLPHKLVLAGRRGWKNKKVLSEISKFSADDVMRIGYVERGDLPFVYQMADVFVFVSLYEGFGFPPLEAMACGVPVVASECGAPGETIKGACYIVDASDHEKTAQAIYLMITDEGLRKKYIERGIKASKRFSWDNAAKKTLAIYKEAVESNA